MLSASQSRVSRAMLLLGMAWLTSLCSGCHTPEGPGADSLAAVQIPARDPLIIARAVSKVFQEAGFQPTPLPANRGRELNMMFEKEGTAKDTMFYGDWSFKPLWYRAKIRIAALQPETASGLYLVTCDVFRVADRGDRHFEEEHRIKSKRGFFQDLLDKAKVEASRSP